MSEGPGSTKSPCGDADEAATERRPAAGLRAAAALRARLDSRLRGNDVSRSAGAPGKFQVGLPVLWLSIAVAYAVAKLCVDQLNFGHLAAPLSHLGEILFVASGQTLVYRSVLRR